MKSTPPHGSAKRHPAGVQHAVLQFAELFDGLDEVLFWIKDRRGRYLHVNRAFLLNFDLQEPAQAVGKTDYDLSPAFLADQFVTDDERVLKGHKVVGRIELVGGADQAARWNVTHKLPLRDTRGRVIGTTGTTRPLKSAERSMSGGHGLEHVLLRIRDGYHGPLTNGELATQAGLSVRAFERKFLQVFHLPPQQYIRKLRVRMATRALVFTDKPLAEVAIECGFADQSHFGHEFRKHTGRTPRAYREHYRIT
ncbi:AraC family transcriptional regulator [Roseimicrobium sp. ORNL1]|uniref:AraC family transcriptional regulator n=1 Tax=Roseimicrobium sp. ORNL1 TaxID=2711231 RepID=UPI0013E192B8|nr:AraC family transcriptional regulator [Roseimicrobium sp. ORNL1]QIE99973.1 AraC family transcriptional regulator [Roseimicrobium sp. ORNL1]